MHVLTRLFARLRRRERHNLPRSLRPVRSELLAEYAVNGRYVMRVQAVTYENGTNRIVRSRF